MNFERQCVVSEKTLGEMGSEIAQHKIAADDACPPKIADSLKNAGWHFDPPHGWTRDGVQFFPQWCRAVDVAISSANELSVGSE